MVGHLAYCRGLAGAVRVQDLASAPASVSGKGSAASRGQTPGEARLVAPTDRGQGGDLVAERLGATGELWFSTESGPARRFKSQTYTQGGRDPEKAFDN